MNKPVYLYITPFFPSPDNWRGAYCLDFVKALRKARPGMRIEVLVAGGGGDYEIEGIKVWRFQEKILKGCVLPFLFRRRNEQSFLAAVARAGVKLEEVAVCHGNTARFAIYPLAVKRRNPNCKTLLHHHDLASFGLNLGVLHKCALYNAWLFRKLRSLHEQVDCHVFISEASRRSFLAAPDASWTVYEDYKAQMRGPKALGCGSAQIRESVVLHNGVDVGVFKRLADSSWQLVGCDGKKEFVIGCVGNFWKLKDQLTLLLAVEQLAVGSWQLASSGDGNSVSSGERVKIKVVFIGSGPERKKCEEYARAHWLDAEFRDEVRHEELPVFYHSIDLFVLPSYFEGFGCVYTEAWACGVPFIACEGQGVEDLIAPEDRGKWLCKPQDAEDLAGKIAAYYQSRYPQHLVGDIAIDKLVQKFLEELAL